MKLDLTVAGEGQRNADGTKRQAIIAKLNVGDVVTLVREQDNRFDGNAVRVDSRLGTIGYVARDEAPAVATVLDTGEVWHARIRHIGGGTTEKRSLGVWLEAQRDKLPPKRTSGGLLAALRALFRGKKGD